MLELPAGMQHGEDHFERAFFRGWMFVDRNAAAVVGDGDRAAVRVQRDNDVRSEAVHGFVDRVVENLPDQVVQAGRADAADVHAGPLTYRLQPFEYGYVLGGIATHCGRRRRPWRARSSGPLRCALALDRKSIRLNSSHSQISY